MLCDYQRGMTIDSRGMGEEWSFHCINQKSATVEPTKCKFYEKWKSIDLGGVSTECVVAIKYSYGDCTIGNKYSSKSISLACECFF